MGTNLKKSTTDEEPTVPTDLELFLAPLYPLSAKVQLFLEQKKDRS